MAAMGATEPGALRTLPSSRRSLLRFIKEKGEAGADDLAAALDVTVSAVRQHLAGLEADGLVTHREERIGPGRPRHLYFLTEAGELLFPRAYGELASELLDYVAAEDPELVERVFERRRGRRVAAATTRLAGKSLAEQVQELTEILDADGYLATCEEIDGGWRIVEHNCAILAVAARYGTACGTELDFIREVLPGASVERVAHLMAGGHVCAYEVRPLSRPRGRQAVDGSRRTSAGSLSIRSPR
jgi:DeoR family suf operon transcriptional repressor